MRSVRFVVDDVKGNATCSQCYRIFGKFCVITVSNDNNSVLATTHPLSCPYCWADVLYQLQLMRPSLRYRFKKSGAMELIKSAVESGPSKRKMMELG